MWAFIAHTQDISLYYFTFVCSFHIYRGDREAQLRRFDSETVYTQTIFWLK
jgi:hypothetical protein